MYNDVVLSKLNNLKYLYVVKKSNVSAMSKKNQFNDMVKFYAQINTEDVIQKISFKATGCTHFIVFCDYFCELVEGKTIKNALKIDGDKLETLVSLDESKKHIISIILDTFALLVKKYRKGIENGLIQPCEVLETKEKVVTTRTISKGGKQTNHLKELQDILVTKHISSKSNKVNSTVEITTTTTQETVTNSTTTKLSKKNAIASTKSENAVLAEASNKKTARGKASKNQQDASGIINTTERAETTKTKKNTEKVNELSAKKSRNLGKNKKASIGLAVANEQNNTTSEKGTKADTNSVETKIQLKSATKEDNAKVKNTIEKVDKKTAKNIKKASKSEESKDLLAEEIKAKKNTKSLKDTKVEDNIINVDKSTAKKNGKSIKDAQNTDINDNLDKVNAKQKNKKATKIAKNSLELTNTNLNSTSVSGTKVDTYSVETTTNISNITNEDNTLVKSNSEKVNKASARKSEKLAKAKKPTIDIDTNKGSNDVVVEIEVPSNEKKRKTSKKSAKTSVEVIDNSPVVTETIISAPSEMIVSKTTETTENSDNTNENQEFIVSTLNNNVVKTKTEVRRYSRKTKSVSVQDNQVLTQESEHHSFEMSHTVNGVTSSEKSMKQSSNLMTLQSMIKASQNSNKNALPSTKETQNNSAKDTNVKNLSMMLAKIHSSNTADRQVATTDKNKSTKDNNEKTKIENKVAPKQTPKTKKENAKTKKEKSASKEKIATKKDNSKAKKENTKETNPKVQEKANVTNVETKEKKKGLFSWLRKNK